MPQRLRIFISSPGDVPDERLRANLIVDKLSLDYSRFFSIESYRWEHEAMLASAHFQDAIEPPSAFDIVVLILWSRLGTPLPERTAAREYCGMDGRVPVTGTEWEYEEALKAAQDKKAPDLLAFRNISPAPVDTRDPDVRSCSVAQLDALDQFWRRHFADRGVFLAAYDEYRTLEEFAQRLEESLRKLIERRIKSLALTESAAPLWLGDPFRGLESYDFEHAPIFFGRDAATTKATEQLAANARVGHAFLLVSGASGSGKSSLVKAGIVPRLMKPQRISGAAFLRRAVFRPGSSGADIFLGLAEVLTRPSDNQGVGLRELTAKGQEATQLAIHLRNTASEPAFSFDNALGRLTEVARSSGRLLAFEHAKLILVVDQLEELFIPGIDADDRRLFIQLLAGLARSKVVWVIATLRDDFWHRAAEIPELIGLAEGQGRIDLAAPSPAELAEMIRKPAQAAGLSFEGHAETGLDLDAVLAEHAAAAPGALPLLSFTLDELYKDARARGGAVLTHASYQALGGLDGAITKRADETLARLPARAQTALPRVLRALTTVSGAAEQKPVAQTAPLALFAEGTPARILVDAFVEARLLVAAHDGDAAPSMRIAHEALISRWQRARDQLSADRRDLETRALVERQFGRWSHADARARRLLLLRNPDLANAIDLARRWGDELDSPTCGFIRSSARRARLAQSLTAVAAVLFAIVASAAVFAERQAVHERQRAEQTLAAATKTANDLVHDLAQRFKDAIGVPAGLIKDILDRARALQEQLIKSGQGTPDLKRSEAAALIALAQVTIDLGDAPSALSDAEQAQSIFDDLVSAAAQQESARSDEAYCDKNPITGLTKQQCISVQQDTHAININVRQQDLATSYEQIGEVLRRAGRSDDGLSADQKALAIFERLAPSYPADLTLQSELAQAYIAVGDALEVAGSADKRLDYYRRALIIRERLAADQPNDSEWQDAVRDSDQAIAGVLLFAEGQNGQALDLYRKALAIAQALATKFPNDSAKQEILYTSQNTIGDAFLESDQNAQAIEAYRSALSTIEKLASTDPQNRQWQRFLMAAYNRLATALLDSNQREQAKTFFENAFLIAQNLVQTDPSNLLWESDLAVSYGEQGRLAADEGNYDVAIANFRHEMAIYEQLSAAVAANTTWQSDLATAYEKLGYALVASGNSAEGLVALHKSLEIYERLTAADLDNDSLQGRLGVVLVQLGLIGDRMETRLSRGLSILHKLRDQGKADEEEIYWMQRGEQALTANK